jgi:outer membrane protein assembly factor BamB
VHGDIAYVTDLDGKAYAINVGTGEAIWENNTFKAAEAIRAARCLDNILVVADRGETSTPRPGDGPF